MKGLLRCVTTVGLLGVLVAACSGASPLNDGSELEDVQVAPIDAWNTHLAVDGTPRRSDDGTWVLVRIVITNVSGSRLHAKTKADGWQFRAYMTPARSGNPNWRSEQGLVVYQAVLRDLTLEPGESHDRELLLGPIKDIAADDTPRVYYLAGVLRFGDPDFRTREFPIGEITLP